MRKRQGLESKKSVDAHPACLAMYVRAPGNKDDRKCFLSGQITHQTDV